MRQLRIEQISALLIVKNVGWRNKDAPSDMSILKMAVSITVNDITDSWKTSWKRQEIVRLPIITNWKTSLK